MRPGDFIVSRRKLVLTVLGVLAVVAAIGLTRLRTDFTVDDLFADAGDLRRITEQARERFGNTDNALLVIQVRGSGETGEDGWAKRLELQASMGEAIKDVDGVFKVTSLASIPLNGQDGLLKPVSPAQRLSPEEVRARLDAALATPLIRGRLVSADLSVAVTVVQLDRDVLRADELRRTVADVNAIAERAKRETSDSISLGGLPHVRVEVVSAMNKDQARLLPIGFAICLIVLLIAFRWWPALVLPLIAVGIAALICIGSMSWTGTAMNVVTNIVPLLIVIIGVSDSIHLISRHLEDFAANGDRFASAGSATNHVFIACLLTSVTTALGFASLLASGIGVLRVFGIVAASGVLIAFAVTVTFLPAAISGFVPPKRGGLGGVRRWSLAPFTRFLLRHRWPVLAALLAFSALASASLRYLEVDEGVRRQFDRDTAIGRTMTILEDKLEGLRPVDLLISAKGDGALRQPALAAAIDEISGWAAAQPETLAARSVADVFREIRFTLSAGKLTRDVPLGETTDPGLIAAYQGATLFAPDLITADFRHARVAISMADIGSGKTLDFTDRLLERAAAALAPFEGVEVEVAGEGYSSSLGLESLIRDLARSLAIAVFAIFVILALVFRSVRLAAVGVGPSGLPIVFGLAYMVVRGIPLGTATVIVFSVALGLAVDGTIHVLARHREELGKDGSADDALVRAIDGSGPPIIATCLTLVVGFGILSLSSFVPIRQFGELIAVSIAGSLVCQLVLLPPLLAVFGRRR